jgi:hypothetical protein
VRYGCKAVVGVARVSAVANPRGDRPGRAAAFPIEAAFLVRPQGNASGWRRHKMPHIGINKQAVTKNTTKQLKRL